MKRTLLAAITSAAIVCGPAALAESMAGEHKVILPENIQWGAAPPSLPSGAESAVLLGDPTKEGMFTLRLKMPKGYSISPHTHPKPEVITVISGNLSLGMGVKANRAAAVSLPAGSFSSIPPGVAHFVFVDEESIVQINAAGPWAVDYIDPRDDPRLNIAPTERKTPTRD